MKRKSGKDFCITAVLVFLLVYPAFGARIGLFFGNFDPVHAAHVLIVTKSFKTLNLDRIYAIPFQVSDSEFPVSFRMRCEMLKKILQNGAEQFKVPCEKLEGWDQDKALPLDPHLFAQRVLKELLYWEGWDHQYFQIMGTDEFQILLKTSGFPPSDQPLSIVVIKRPGFNRTIPRHLIPELGERLFPIDLDTPRVSSREIRALLEQGKISPHLSEEAAEYIKEKQLYGFPKSN